MSDMRDASRVRTACDQDLRGTKCRSKASRWGIKFNPELHFSGVEGITDALDEVKFVAEKIDIADGIIALRVS